MFDQSLVSHCGDRRRARPLVARSSLLKEGEGKTVRVSE